MKKLFTLVAVMAFVLSAMAQTPKMVFIEEGTQASCPPCATMNPAFDALLEANDDNVVVLKYQTSWPGFDQMNLDNPTEVADRVSYYGFNGVPTGFANGALWANDCGAWEGAPACYDQAELDADAALMSPLGMTISGELVDGILTITGSVDASMAAAGDLKLRIALTEQHITSASAPGGTNGETDYYNVMKKFIGGTAGFDLADMAAGESYTINETFDISSLTIYDYSALGLVAFVQDDATKEVIQAAKDNTVDIILNFENNAASGEVSGLPEASCSSEASVSPVITIQNTGNTPLTSLDITYDVNGGTPAMYNWTGGPLSALASEMVTLPSYDFTSAGSNTINVEISNPNGSADENDLDNSSTADFELSIVVEEAEEELTLTINTDCWAAETGWEFRSLSSGAIVASAPTGSYDGQDLSEIIESITAPAGDCYEFRMIDTYGDGLNGAQWGSCGVDGNATLVDASGDVIYENTGALQYESDGVNFTSTVVGLDENYYVTEFNTFPNPVADELTVNFSVSHSAFTTVEVVNPVGQIISSTTLGDLPVGEYNEKLDMSTLSEGVYLVRIISAGEVATARVTVAK